MIAPSARGRKRTCAPICCNPTGKLGSFHLAMDDGRERAILAVGAVDENARTALHGWREEGESLDVIPMHVRQEERDVEIAPFGNDLPSERANASACIENHPAVVDFNGNTGRVSSIFDGAGAGDGDASAHSPEFDPHRRFI